MPRSPVATFATVLDIVPVLRPYWSDALALDPIWWAVLSIFGLCWLVQMFFWATKLARTAGYRPEREPEGPASPLPLSVVICCHNDLAGVQRLLGALAMQTYSHFETVVVDDRSDDDVYDWLLSESRKPGARFRLVRVNARPEHISGKKYALTLGIKAARYEALLLTDADCIPSSDTWVSRMAAALLQPGKQVVLGYAPYEPAPGLLNSLIRYDTFYTALQYVGYARAGRPYMGVGRNLAYQRSLFYDTKGFSGHAAQAGGDDDLFINQAVRQCGKEAVALCLHPDAQMHSPAKTSFGGWFRQKRRHLAAGRQYKAADKWSLGLLQGSHVGFYAAGLALLAAYPLTFLVGLAFVARLSLTWPVQYRAARRLGERFPAFSLPLLDAWMPLHYLIFGIPALFSKRIAWT